MVQSTKMSKWMVDIFRFNANMSAYSYRVPDVFSEQITGRTGLFGLCQVEFFHRKRNICIDLTLPFCPAVEN